MVIGASVLFALAAEMWTCSLLRKTKNGLRIFLMSSIRDFFFRQLCIKPPLTSLHWSVLFVCSRTVSARGPAEAFGAFLSHREVSEYSKRIQKVQEPGFILYRHSHASLACVCPSCAVIQLLDKQVLSQSCCLNYRVYILPVAVNREVCVSEMPCSIQGAGSAGSDGTNDPPEPFPLELNPKNERQGLSGVNREALGKHGCLMIANHLGLLD